ncbi:MAG TPA: DUF5693 family protein [Elusimicrobiota bacterium]|nr:DUF5693 family protein [Elusimicrobiota bacterium]
MNGFRRLSLLVALAVALAAAAGAPRRAGDRAVLAAVDAGAMAALQGKRPEASGELWERLKAMGVSAVTLREETLADLAASGEVLNYSRAEVDRWRAAGLVAPSSALRGGTLWAKDAKSFARAADAFAARGLDVSTAAVAGAKALEIPAGADLSKIPAGFDPASVAALAGAGLFPVAASTAAVVDVAGRRLWTRTLPVDAAPGEILRAALGRPLRLIVFRPRPELGLEENLTFLRASLKTLRDAGQPDTLPAPRPDSGEGRAARAGRLALVWLLGLAGPLLAARAALQAGRLARSKLCTIASLSTIAPVASPVPQVLAGLAAAWAVSAFAGLVVAGVAPEGWRDGSARAWTVWTWCAPFAVGAAALFASAKPSRRGYWAAPVRRRDLVALIAFALAAALLLAPRASLRASAFWESFDRLSAAGALWWWPWYWRAALVGVPCLALSLALVEERDAADPRQALAKLASDPRGWLLLGLLGPAGLVAATGGGGAPIDAGLLYGAAAWALGLATAAALAALRVFLQRWAQGPSAHRTIDLERRS